MPASEKTWAEIKRAWCETTDKPGAISLRTGVPHLVICARARREGWKRPASLQADEAPEPSRRTVDQRPAKRKAKPRSPATTFPRRARDALIHRLYAAIGAKLTQLEKRMASDDQPLTQEESERQTRELGSMIQGFEKVTEVATDAAKSDAVAAPASPIATPADVERVRHELAQRLHRMYGREKP